MIPSPKANGSCQTNVCWLKAGCGQGFHCIGKFAFSGLQKLHDLVLVNNFTDVCQIPATPSKPILSHNAFQINVAWCLLKDCKVYTVSVCGQIQSHVLSVNWLVCMSSFDWNRRQHWLYTVLFLRPAFILFLIFSKVFSPFPWFVDYNTWHTSRILKRNN